MDAFKASRPWVSGSSSPGGQWSDNRAIAMDANGWPTSLLANQVLHTLLFTGLDNHYPSGQYVVLYDGSGSMTWGGGATVNVAQSAPGRTVLDVDSSKGGIWLDVTGVDSADHLRNIRLIMPGGSCGDLMTYCETNADCGAEGTCTTFEKNYVTQVFHPKFLQSIEMYSTLRFMDWMSTNNSPQKNWSDRPTPTYQTFSASSPGVVTGVPVEVMVQLANRIHANPWFNMPHLATDDYVTQFATVVKNKLDPTLKAYIEHSNETWNPGFDQFFYCYQTGDSMGFGGGNDTQAGIEYHAYRSAQMFKIWATVFGGTDRLVRVLGAQFTNTNTIESAMQFQDTAQNVDAIAIAPYFGGALGALSNPHFGDVANGTLDYLFKVALPNSDGSQPYEGAFIGTSIHDAATSAKKWNKVLVAYEAGQSLVGSECDSSGACAADNANLNTLFDAANADPRMGTFYMSYLASWKANGGTLLNHFVNTSTWSKYGRWGARQYWDETRAQETKYNALLTFIEQTPKWW